MLVWDSMRLLFGAAFERNQGSAPTPLWLELLENVTDEQCIKAFEFLRDKRKETWPPNLVEFKQVVMPPSVGVRYLGVPLTEAQLKNLLPSPEKQAPVSTRDFYLAKMRRTLHVPPTERDAAASTLEAAEAQCRCNEIPDGEQCVACRDWESRMLAIARGRA
jgi:hypothetical protein